MTKKKDNGYLRIVAAFVVLVFILVGIAYFSPLSAQPGGQFGELAEGVVYDPADINQDRTISAEELVTAMGWYYDGSYTQEQLDLTVQRWRFGVY